MAHFDETKHLRGQPENPGQFRSHERSQPGSGLSPKVENPLVVDILDSPDPSGGYNIRVQAPTGEYFLLDGEPHRLDGPAYRGLDGSERWFREGNLDRDPADGPALIEVPCDELPDGGVEFYSKGKLVA
jgi:hypothetical protein